MNCFLRHAMLASLLCLLALTACGRGDAKNGVKPDAAAATNEAAPITNRVDIPDAVRRNLGITFARVERRDVARTLRIPGRFELTPTARREYHAPLGGRAELLVTQYQRVEVGTPLYRLDAPSWRGLFEEILATEAKVASMESLRVAHAEHAKSRSEQVALWKQRIAQLDELRAAGGGRASQYTEARAALIETQAELADAMEKHASLDAEEKQAQSTLRTLRARQDALRAVSACAQSDDGSYTVCAVAPGVVEALFVTQGGLAEESAQVLSIVQPEQVRLRARALQGDLGRLRDGLRCTIVAPSAGVAIESMVGVLALGVTADPDGRTIDVVVQPEVLASWARAGVAASLEVTLEGAGEALAIPLAAVVRDGATPIVFRRDPKNADLVIRMEADLGVDDGRWVAIESGVKEGDEIVVAGNYQLLLATSGSIPKGGHFHSDGTFHEGKD